QGRRGTRVPRPRANGCSLSVAADVVCRGQLVFATAVPPGGDTLLPTGGPTGATAGLLVLAAGPRTLRGGRVCRGDDGVPEGAASGYAALLGVGGARASAGEAGPGGQGAQVLPVG